ncbi:MAG: glycosyltransferase family 1 protein [Rhodocyclales bacterium]|nr:glycosyltransferase family 1 protein [Rhodocyclales bacterium]
MGDSLHIAVVSETFAPEVNGVAMTLGHVVAGLHARGHRISLVRPRQSAEDCSTYETGFQTLLVRGLPIPGYPGLRFGLPAARTLKRRWRDDRPDVVQVVTEGPLGASAVGAARALGIPVVTEFHTNFHAYSHHYGFGNLERLVSLHLRRLHNRGDLTVVPSHQLGIDLLRRGYNNIRVVARGVDTALFNPGRRSAELRARWGTKGEDIVVACVGRLAPEKNLDLAMTTFAAIRRFAPGARLLMVGDGPARKPLERAYPEHIYAGTRHGEDLAAHYASADLFLFPSLTETYGNVTLEAMASGLPVVAFRLAAAAELIHHGHNGMLAEPGVNAAFVRSALDLITRPGTRSRISACAAESVATHDWERIHERMACVLREAVRRTKVQAANGPAFHLMPD